MKMIKERGLEATDRDYVTRSLLMSFLSGSSEIKKINKDSYLRAHNETINRLLDAANVLIISDDQEEGLIYGFIIFENAPLADIIHYVYVRRDFRGKGLARKMIEACQSNKDLCALSHLTDDFKPARLKKYWGKVTYDPYARIKK